MARGSLPNSLASFTVEDWQAHYTQLQAEYEALSEWLDEAGQLIIKLSDEADLMSDSTVEFLRKIGAQRRT
jgi:hypothetical protein